MSVNSTPVALRLHIAFFGCRNAGKSSLVNAITDQEVSVVSDVKGTTTDPVQKTMELLPLGPVLIIDTPGYDDSGMLGEKRIERTKRILNKTDIAVLVVDGTVGINAFDRELIELFEKKQIPYLVAYNKCDLVPKSRQDGLCVSAVSREGVNALKEAIASMRDQKATPSVLQGLVKAGDRIVLVIPIDESAPKGRLILPQQQVLRDALDRDVTVTVTKDTTLQAALDSLCAPPALVITDSQVFGTISKRISHDIPLTSFSILMARQKGFLRDAVAAIEKIDALQDGDTVLIAEGCTHHRQCNDIGTVKIPAWLRNYTGKDLHIETSSGNDFPEDLQKYAMVIHCGGCMLNEREVQYRMKCAADQGIAFTNYGTVIAHINGILERSIAPIPEL